MKKGNGKANATNKKKTRRMHLQANFVALDFREPREKKKMRPLPLDYSGFGNLQFSLTGLAREQV
jgi:hypothetical protein